MEKVRLGRTELMVSRTSFGVLPLQRVEREEAARILRRAHEAGINFFDTARGYTDSEEKIGYALADVREDILIASKSGAITREGIEEQLATTLRNLKTDYVDILQLHNPRALPDPHDPNSSYAALVDAKKAGKVRFIGITNHSREVADQAVETDLYDTLQFPLCMISDEQDLALARKAAARDMGVIAMKALSGGLITQARAAFAFLRREPHIVPIWGIQRMEELEEFLALEADPPALDEALWRVIEADRESLSGQFCRGCGYCLPCPADIPIPMAARMHLLLRRMPFESFLKPDWQQRMARIDQCTECGQCAARCPYGLHPSALLKLAKGEYDAFLAAHGA